MNHLEFLNAKRNEYLLKVKESNENLDKQSYDYIEKLQDELNKMLGDILPPNDLFVEYNKHNKIQFETPCANYGRRTILKFLKDNNNVDFIINNLEKKDIQAVHLVKTLFANQDFFLYRVKDTFAKLEGITENHQDEREALGKECWGYKLLVKDVDQLIKDEIFKLIKDGHKFDKELTINIKGEGFKFDYIKIETTKSKKTVTGIEMNPMIFVDKRIKTDYLVNQIFEQVK